MAQSKARVLVVGADFGLSGDQAILEGLRQLANESARALHAVHVLDPADVIDDPEQPVLETELEVIERAPTLLRERIEQLASAHGLSLDARRVFTHARIGKAVETMLQVAVDYDAELIVVGTHGRRGIDRVVLGSVAEALVRTARCPVLVARPKDYTGLSRTELPDPPYKPGEAPDYRAPHDVPEHITSQSGCWEPTGERPTGFRIV